MLLSDLCKIIGVENKFPDIKIGNFCFREKFFRQNSVYFAIVTEGFDGYKFDYRKAKSLNCVIVSTRQIADLQCIIVEDTLKALYATASYYRDLYKNVKGITISGSVGKTSAKEMVYSVLNSCSPTLHNAGSANSTRELCRLIFNLNKDIRYMVMELGLRSPNMPFKQASEILKPDAALITNIGHSHIENFKNKEQILEHKLSMTCAMKNDGVLFLNGDDELLFNSEYKFKTVFFGINNKACDYVAYDIQKTNEGTKFKVKSKDGSTDVELKVNVPGEHNILNALGAYAIAKHFGLNEEDIKRGVEAFQTTGFRQNVVKGYKGNIIIADCYNATPESMISGFEMLNDIDSKGRKIAVLGHMMRLGRLSEELHRKTGQDVLKYDFDLVITFGLDAYYIYEEVIKAGKKALHFYSKLDLIMFLRSFVKSDDAILFKGVEKFHNFQDLFYGFNDENYKCHIPTYEGVLSVDKACHSDAAGMYFGSGDMLFIGKDINKRVRIKDLAIVFAIPLILEKCGFDEKVVISKDAALKFVDNTGIRFNPTNIFTARDLVYASLFKSSFEAIYALIEHAFGSYDEFKKYLYLKFEKLGIKNTRIDSISNVENEKTYTTAYDLYVYIKYALSNSQFENIFSTTEYVLNNLKSGKQTKIATNNKLLVHEKNVTYIDYYSAPVKGIKSENIYSDVNYHPNKSLVSYVTKEGKSIIGVILGSEDFYYCNNSYIDMKRILNICSNCKY